MMPLEIGWERAFPMCNPRVVNLACQYPWRSTNADTRDGTGNPTGSLRQTVSAADCRESLQQTKESPSLQQGLHVRMSNFFGAPWRCGRLSCRDRSPLHWTTWMMSRKKRFRSCSFEEQWRTTQRTRGDRMWEAAQWGGYIATVTGREGMQGCSITTLPMNPSTTTNSLGTGTE